MSKERSAFRDWIEYGVARALLGLAASLPFSFSRGCAALLDAAVPKLRRIARLNLERAGLSPDLADGVYTSIGRLIYGFARLEQIDKTNVAGWIRYEGFEHYEEAKRRGKGVLFATGHLGNWELSAYAHALMCEPMNVVVRALDNPRLDAFVEARRAASGNRIIHKKDFLRGILKALGDNEAVGILIDQNAGLDDGVFVDFFGTPASTSTAFAKLAFRTGAAVIPGFAIWSESERRYILRFWPIVELSGDAAADTALLQKVVESIVREYPDQWLWIHRRWKTRPPGEAPLY